MGGGKCIVINLLYVSNYPDCIKHIFEKKKQVGWDIRVFCQTNPHPLRRFQGDILSKKQVEPHVIV